MATERVALDDLAATLILDRLRFFGPQKARELHRQGLRPSDILTDPNRLTIGGSRNATFRAALRAVTPTERSNYRAQAERQLEAADRYGARILLYDDPAYPPNLMLGSYPIPVLFARGSVDVLRETKAIACVGSRGIREPYVGLHRRFAEATVEARHVVVSGFALGADTIGHRAAHVAGGRTVAVMPGGLDRPFPPENKALWAELLEYAGAVLVSEATFGMRASSMTLRKRNKLIVALSRGVLVSQSSVKGGAMNAYRFALEEKKPVATFEADGLEDTSGNRAIGQDPKAQPTVFRAAGLKPEWQAWLRQFDSWI